MIKELTTRISLLYSKESSKHHNYVYFGKSRPVKVTIISLGPVEKT